CTPRTTSASEHTSRWTTTTTAAASTTIATRSASVPGVKLASCRRFTASERSSDSCAARNTSAADASEKTDATGGPSLNPEGKSDLTTEPALLEGPSTSAIVSASKTPRSAAVESIAMSGAYQPK